MEPIAGKLVESGNDRLPPLDLYTVWYFEDGEWWESGEYNSHQEVLDDDWKDDGRPYRVFHCSDAPPQLPDREKLSWWIFRTLVRDGILSAEDDGDSLEDTIYPPLADLVIALLRDGIPAELMPDEKEHG